MQSLWKIPFFPYHDRVQVTPVTLQRKRHLHSLKKIRGEKSKAEAAEYQKLVAQRAKERAVCPSCGAWPRPSSQDSRHLFSVIDTFVIFMLWQEKRREQSSKRVEKAPAAAAVKPAAKAAPAKAKAAAPAKAAKGKK